MREDIIEKLTSKDDNYACAIAENTGAVAEEFDAGLWCGLVDHVTVTNKENIVVTFKNGLETKVL